MPHVDCPQRHTDSVCSTARESQERLEQLKQEGKGGVEGLVAATLSRLFPVSWAAASRIPVDDGSALPSNNRNQKEKEQAASLSHMSHAASLTAIFVTLV